MKPCFGYIRVSTERQGDGASLEAQKDAITGFASQNNLQIVEWFEERETASKVGRPIFGTMMTALQRGEAEGLVIHKIDRSSRNYRDWSIIDDVLRLGIKVYSAADNLDFDTRGGRLMADIQMALAADYSRNLSLEVKKGIYGRLKHGVYPFRAPLGYLDTGGGNLKALDPAKAPLVRQVFELYCSGDYSITSLTEEMRRRGLKGVGDQLVVRRNIETILRNPFYCGKMIIRGKLYSGAHEPLISTAMFRHVGAIKAQRFTKKATQHRMLFRGLFTCGACSRILTGERQKAHIYYRCHTSGCRHGAIREDRLDEAVQQRLTELQIPPQEQSTLTREVREWLRGDKSEEIEKSLRLRISDATARLDRLTDLLVDGTIDAPAYELRKQNLGFEIQQLREQLASVERNRTAERDLEDLLELATDLASLYQAAPAAQKRGLIRNCLSAPNVGNGELIADGADWLASLTAEPDKRSTLDPNARLTAFEGIRALGSLARTPE